MRSDITLSQIPPDTKGIPYARWYAALPIRAFVDPEELRRHREREAAVGEKAVSTPRDRYGWRSLPSGSLFLGAAGRRKS